MSDSKTAYPLYWPDGWPRTPQHQRQESRFLRSSNFTNRRHSIDEARRTLADELGRLNATDSLLSSNLELRIDGKPYSTQNQPQDVGVAVFFKLKGKEVSLACDKWKHVECNIVAISKHIEALRGQQRWGVGDIEQAFRGYTALPAPGQSGGDNPWKVLGLAINATEDQLAAAYRALVKKFHPDNPATGNREEFEKIQNAYNLIAQNLRSQPPTT